MARRTDEELLDLARRCRTQGGAAMALSARDALLWFAEELERKVRRVWPKQ